MNRSSSGRRAGFKKGIDAGQGRRSREASALSLRRAKKDDSLAKRRNMTSDAVPGLGAPAQGGAPGQAPAAAVGGTPGAVVPAHKYTAADIPALCASLSSNDPAALVAPVRAIRKLLSVTEAPPVDAVIHGGAVPQLSRCLHAAEHPELLFEAAWALTNIASTDRTSVVFEAGVVQQLVLLLRHVHADVREQAGWCLGNVAGDCTTYRDAVLAAGALEPLMLNLQQPASPSLLRNCTWTMSNFCRGKPQPDLKAVAPAVPMLAYLMKAAEDEEVVVDAAWALSYVSDGESDRIEAVIQQDVAPRLVKMLGMNKMSIVTPAVRTLGNFASGDERQTQVVIDSGALPALVPLMSVNQRNIRKEVCWLVSNIAAGTHRQISALVGEPGLLEAVSEQLSESAKWEVRREAAWVVTNVVGGGQPQHLLRVLQVGALKHLCDLLDVSDVRILLLALDAIDNLLTQAPKLGASVDVVHMLQEADGVEKIEALQEHNNEEVYRKAARIITNHLMLEEESENALPNTTAQGTFAFGVGPAPSAAAGGKGFFSFGAPAPAAPASVVEFQPSHVAF